jgi:hypothetical protein
MVVGLCCAEPLAVVCCAATGAASHSTQRSAESLNFRVGFAEPAFLCVELGLIGLLSGSLLIFKNAALDWKYYLVTFYFVG